MREKPAYSIVDILRRAKVHAPALSPVRVIYNRQPACRSEEERSVRELPIKKNVLLVNLLQRGSVLCFVATRD